MPPKNNQVENTSNIIRFLRDAVSPKGKKSLWLRDLPDDKLAEVYSRLRLGQGSQRLARLVKDEWNLFPDKQVGSLRRGIRVFAERVLTDEESIKNEDIKKDKRNVGLKIKNMKKKIDGIQTLMWLINCETERYSIFLEREKKFGLPLEKNATSKVAENITKACQALIDRQIELGLLDRQPDKVELEVKGTLEHFVGSLPDGGAKMLEFGRHFAGLIKEHCERVDLVKLPDGTYATKEENGDGSD